MRCLAKLPLLAYIPLLSSLYFVGSTEAAIAIASVAQRGDQELPIVQNIQLVASTLDQPVVSPGRSHRPSSPSAPPSSNPFPTFNSQQFDQQLQRYLRFVAQAGQPDILIVGSSRALQGIDPIVLQQTLTRRGYPKLKIFNFGINGATAQLVDLLLRKLLTPDQLPRLLLWADGVRAFNSGRVDITYNRAIASSGYQLLMTGIRPIFIALEAPLLKQFCTPLSLQPLARDISHQPKSFNVVAAFAPSFQQQWCWAALKAIDQPDRSVKPNESATRLQEVTGFQSLSNQFKPDEYFQRYPKVQGAYDADYRNFTLSGQQTDALHNIMMFAKARQIPLVFVNLPLTQIYLDETRAAKEQQFRHYLERFVRSRSFTVHDLSQRWLHQHAYFTDPSHLNRDGAAAVANQLGKRLTLPSAQY